MCTHPSVSSPWQFLNVVFRRAQFSLSLSWIYWFSTLDYPLLPWKAASYFHCHFLSEATPFTHSLYHFFVSMAAPHNSLPGGGSPYFVLAPPSVVTCLLVSYFASATKSENSLSFFLLPSFSTQGLTQFIWVSASSTTTGLVLLPRLSLTPQTPDWYGLGIGLKLLLMARRDFSITS